MDSYSSTVAALSTPPGESGIAVVRITGPDALAILSRVYRTPAGQPKTGRWEHRRLYHGTLLDTREAEGAHGAADEAAGAGGELIDEVMCAVMRAPDTYTGEDVVEISCHGGTLIVSRVLNLLFSEGASPAEPGEFTKRAFLNGKMDLIQAEAVADLIHARSELQRQVAQKQLNGELSRRIEKLADQMTELLASIEANIDFIEEDIDTLDREGAAALLDAQLDELESLLFSAPFHKPFHEGYRVAIAGPVNAGKSSIFNRLVGGQRAIVTDIPGTTRDVLREPVVLRGLLFVFQDTAGLRGGTPDRIETIGMGLADEAAREADVVVFVVDASSPLSADLEARLRGLDARNTVLALNKIDLPESEDASNFKTLRPDVRSVRVSALTGEGFEGLERTIVDAAAGGEVSRIAKERLVLNDRLVSLIEAASKKAKDLKRTLETGNHLEIMALEAREALLLYEEATGRRYQDSVLDKIFSRFCIGK